jgi:hypothetical protein
MAPDPSTNSLLCVLDRALELAGQVYAQRLEALLAVAQPAAQGFCTRHSTNGAVTTQLDLDSSRRQQGTSAASQPTKPRMWPRT